MEGEILSRMVRQIRRLEGTIREIQRLSVLLGEKPERISDREFSALLQEVLEKAREDRKDLRVRVDIAEKEGTGLLPLSRGEAFVLLSNLITNAFSFNVPGGEVAITVAFGESELRLTLENTTSPPDAEFLRWFFDPTEALPRGGSGKGVGLYLIREVVERGERNDSSAAPERSSSFRDHDSLGNGGWQNFRRGNPSSLTNLTHPGIIPSASRAGGIGRHAILRG